MTLQAGINLGPYLILSPLGSGGMGEVFRARDTRLDREVAVKVLPQKTAEDPDALRRFEREAKVLAALSHPNILTIHDFGAENGIHYVVTELLDGETLRDRISRSVIPWESAVEIMIGVAEGLYAAHTRNIIHRDLKPENVFLASAAVKILDFGLAHVDALIPTSDQSSALTIQQETLPGTVLGTINYMAPEQIRGLVIDNRSDLFSFGCVLYEMLTGSRPFLRDTAADTMAAVLMSEPLQLSKSGVLLPPELEEIIARCLMKQPEMRYQCGQDLIFALQTLQKSDHALVKSPAVRPRKSKRAIDSIAILPLVNVTGDPEAEYLCDGITETIINNLSQLPKIRVMARSTVFRYKGQVVDPQSVGVDLNVRAVLTGRLILRGDTLHIQAELVDVKDGSQLWGDRYSRMLSDIFELQDEIAREISTKLRVRLMDAEKKRLGKRYTKNTEAYTFYLRGRYHWNKRTEEGFYKAIDYFEQAIRQDPDLALAYSGLSDCYSLLAGFHYMDMAEGYARARDLALRALEIDDSLAEGHASLAIVRYRVDWNWYETEREFKRAIELNPGYTMARHWYAVYLVMMGRFEEALAEIERAIEQDPLSLVINWTRGFLYYYLRRYDEAIDYLHKTLDLEPEFSRANYDLGIIYVQKEMIQEASEEFRKWGESNERHAATDAMFGYAYAVTGRTGEAQQILKQLEKTPWGSAYSVALICIALGQTNDAFVWLEKSIAAREDALVSLKVNPRVDPIRSDPRFESVLLRIGLK